MLRILLTALFGYWAYRVWNEVSDRPPVDFRDDLNVGGPPVPVSAIPSGRNRIAGTID